MTESFVIHYPPTPPGKKAWNKEYGLNAYYSGKHWSKRKADADYWHKLVKSAMEGQKVRRFPFENPVIITFFWNDRLDCSNHAIMAKMIEDGMCGRIIKDDSRRHVRGIEHYFHDENYIRIVVREV